MRHARWPNRAWKNIGIDDDLAVELESLGVDARLFRAYAHKAIPDHAKHVKLKIGPDGNKDGSTRRRPITATAVAQHLLGHHIFAVNWGDSARMIVVDLDAKNAETKATLRDRYCAVIDALGREPVVLRSSESGGLHLYYFTRKATCCGQTRARVEARLRRCGIELQGGRVEVWPSGSALRLPLGRNSAIVHPTTLEPIWENIPGTNLGAGVRLFLDLAQRRQFRTQDLLGHSREANRDKVTGRKTQANQRPAASVQHKNRGGLAPRERGSSHEADAPMWEVWLAGMPEGQRHDRWREVIFHARMFEARSREDAEALLRGFLRNRNHASKDLSEPDRDKVIDEMMGFARAELGRIEDGLDDGRLQRPSRSTTAVRRELAGADIRYIERAIEEPAMRRALLRLMEYIAHRLVDDDGHVTGVVGVPGSAVRWAAAPLRGAEGRPVARLKSVAKSVLGLLQVQNHSTFEGIRRTRQFVFGYQFGSGQLPELRRSSRSGILLRDFSEAGVELVTDDKKATWRLTREKEAELRGLMAQGWKRPFDPVAHLFAGLKARRTEIDAALQGRLVRDSWLDDGDLMDHIRRCRRDDARRRAVAVALPPAS